MNAQLRIDLHMSQSSPGKIRPLNVLLATASSIKG